MAWRRRTLIGAGKAQQAWAPGLRALPLALVLGLLAAPVANARSERSYTREIARLKQQRTEQKARADGLQGQVDKLAGQMVFLTLDRDQLRRRTTALEGDVAQKEADNANLRKGLPDAILAVPLNEFWPLVFTPARQKWPCDSYFQSGDFWSLSFDRPYQYC